MSKVKVRFAPSPTGRLHVGNLRTALVNYLYARSMGGEFMLRIDDTDTERSTAEFEQEIRADLEWMGMTHDAEARQSDRLSSYDEAIEKLAKMGRAYRCYETPEELALKRKAKLAAGRPPGYDREGLGLDDAQRAAFEAEGRRPHWRFLLEEREVAWQDMVRGDVSYHMSSLSDPVLMREDGRVIYTLASVVDDIDHAITHIIRGEDHTTNSAAQIQLFDALGASAPTMGHVALIAGGEGQGLSKRSGSLSIGELRERGIEPEALASLLARIGTSDPVEALSEMAQVIKGFDISRFGRATAKFDEAELGQVNMRVIQQLEHDRVASRLGELGVGGGEAFWLAVRGNIERVTEAQEWWGICDGPIKPSGESGQKGEASAAGRKGEKGEGSQAGQAGQAGQEDEVLKSAAALLPDGELGPDVWGEWTAAVGAATGAKGGKLFMPIRMALTGRRRGPEIANLLAFMGRERVLARLEGREA